MKTSLKTIALACAALAAPVSFGAVNGTGTVGSITYEQVRFYKPSSTTWPTQSGTVGTDHCSGADICGEPMSFWSAAGGTFKVTASDATNDEGIVIQDLSPNYGGLGVVSLGRNGVYGSDGINRGETLTLTFDKKVTIVGLHFFDADNSNTESGDKGKLRIDGGSNNTIALKSYVTANTSSWLTGTTFVFSHDNNDYHLGAVKLLMPVPEPGTYGMLLAGLGLVGFVARRRTPA